MSEASEMIKQFCETGNVEYLNQLSELAREKFILSCAHTLFQGQGNKKIAMAALKHFGILETFFKAGGKDIIRYTNTLSLENALQNLLFVGAATVPVYQLSELDDLDKSFNAACHSFPEYARTSANKNKDGKDILYVLGGFAALGNPASFHNMFVRNLRQKANKAVKKELFSPLLKTYPDPNYSKKVRSQVLFDRMMWRPSMQEPTAEAWHRDIMSKDIADVKPGDIIFGGWVNTSKQSQGFSFIPGSHLNVDLYELKSGGFAEPGFIYDKPIDKVKKEIKNTDNEDEIKKLKDNLKGLRQKRKALYELFKKYKTRAIVPPGHAIIFPQYVLHEVVSKGVNHDVKRVFTGYRLTTSKDLLIVDKKTRRPVLEENIKTQSIMRLGGGMRPPIYSANHGMSFLRKKFFIFGSKNPKHGKKAKASDQIKETTISWSKNTFKERCLINRPSRKGNPAYQIVYRYMPSLEKLGLPLYPLYTEEEKKIYYPQLLLDKKKQGKATLTIVTWNVNSIRTKIVDTNASSCKLKSRPVDPKSPLGEVITRTNPDIICFQETKCTADTRQCFKPEGFYHYWNCSTTKKGYSGVSLWSKIEPEKVSKVLPGLSKESKHLQKEGRILTAFYDDFILVTTYTPNTGRAGTKNVKGIFPRPEFMKHRANWDAALLKYLIDLEKQNPVIWCGDMNVARGPMDIYKGEMTKDKLKGYGKVVHDDIEVAFYPRDNLTKGEKTTAKKFEKRWLESVLITEVGGGAAYRLQERRDMEKFMNHGFIDAYREFTKGKSYSESESEDESDDVADSTESTYQFFSRSSAKNAPVKMGNVSNWRQKLSNYWPTKIPFIDGVFPSVEHAFHYAKLAFIVSPDKFADTVKTARKKYVTTLPAKKAGEDSAEWFKTTIKPLMLKIKSSSGRAAMKKMNIELRVKEWDEKRTGIMRTLIKKRFKHDEEFRDIIMATGNHPLLHFEKGSGSAPSFWGGYIKKDTGKLMGENMLGKIYMELRRKHGRTKIRPYGFTYWDMTRPAFRSVNYGLRLDYFIISNVLEHKIKNIEVLPDIGLSNTKPVKVSSDHAPVVLSLII